MALDCKTPADVLKALKDEDIPFVDLRFTDPRGKWQHLTMCSDFIEDDSFVDGIMFDGSSIAGWKAINESDMALIPDASTAVMDPFAAQPSMIMFCDIMEPTTGQPYGRDPRSVAKKAEAYLGSTGIGDTAYFGSEAEFFVFDDVRFDVQMNSTFFEFDSEEGPYVTGKLFDDGNLGHRPGIKGGYFPVPPVDSAHDLRAEVTVMQEMGLNMDKHHHGSAVTARAWHDLRTLVRAADNLQIYKYYTHMTLIPTARRQPSCQNRPATTARACTRPIHLGDGSRLSLVRVTPTFRKRRYTISAESLCTPKLSMPLLTRLQTATSG